MKRTISLIIAIAVMVSMFIVPVSAADVTAVSEIAPGESVLQGNISGTLTITSGDYVIDLNGHEWVGQIFIQGGNVTIKDTSTEAIGGIDASNMGDAIDISGGTLVLEDTIVVGAHTSGDAVFVSGGNVTIRGCILTAGKVGLDVTSSAATVVVEDTVFADFESTGLPKDGAGRNAAIELRNNAKVALNGYNFFLVDKVICRSNTHSASFEDSFVLGENVTATFTDETDLGSESGNPYLGATITYEYEDPTAEPTTEPTTEPTVEPTVEPTAEPTSEPTTEPTVEPTVEPTAEPTSEPTTEPTVEPTVEPTAEPTNEITVPVEDVEFDLEAMGGTADFAPHGYEGKIGLMFGYGNFKSLGNLDLSKYSKIIITYATHHPYLNKYDDMPCNSMFAICTNGTTVGYSNVDKRAEAGILAQQDTTNSTAGWAGGERTCEIDLSNVDYNGEVFLSHYNSTGMEALVTKIVLVAAEGATTVVPGGSTDSGNTNNGNSNPNTGNFMPFVIVVAAAAFVVTVVSKKRAF